MLFNQVHAVVFQNNSVHLPDLQASIFWCSRWYRDARTPPLVRQANAADE